MSNKPPSTTPATSTTPVAPGFLDALRRGPNQRRTPLDIREPLHNMPRTPRPPFSLTAGDLPWLVSRIRRTADEMRELVCDELGRALVEAGAMSEERRRQAVRVAYARKAGYLDGAAELAELIVSAAFSPDLGDLERDQERADNAEASQIVVELWAMLDRPDSIVEAVAELLQEAAEDARIETCSSTGSPGGSSG